MKKTPKKIKKYIENNVYEESLKRINHIFDVFDTIVVLFSGGKDSLATLHLVKEVAFSRGIYTVNVVFRDEEFISSSIINFVNEYRIKDWIDMKYFCVPTWSTKYVLGSTKNVIQWDKQRKHVREIPKHAIQHDKIFNKHQMDAYISGFYKGKIAFVNGIRATESLVRFASCMNKVNENYINKTECNKNSVRLCKPIFDWEENDVFKYFFDNNIKYCPVYDMQMWNDENLRVASPIHQEASKRFYKLRTLDPTLYQQIVDIFPEMILQDKYYREFDLNALYRKYDKDMHGVLSYIKEYISDKKQKHLAYRMFKKAVVANNNNPIAYPVAHVLKQFISGAYKRGIYPVSKNIYEQRTD